MKAAYGSPWRDREASVDNSNASSSHKMPPLLRLNSTGESPSIDERSAQSMGQQKTDFSSSRKQRGFIGKITSHLVSQTHTPAARHLLDIHTAVGGITSLDEHLGGHRPRTMASYVARGAQPLDRQAAKMPKPFMRANPSQLRANRYGQWTVDGQSPYMQPGVFPCHVFSAMQGGSAFSQTFPCLWGGQTSGELLASVSDSVLNCKVSVGQFPLQVSTAAFSVGGKNSLYSTVSRHTCDKEPPSSQHKSPCQLRTGAESGHCVNAAQSSNDHQCHCVCEREGDPCSPSSSSLSQPQDSCLPQYRENGLDVANRGHVCTSTSLCPEPCKTSAVSLCSKSTSNVTLSKACEISSCDNKTTEEVAKDTDIPQASNMANVRTNSSKASSLLRVVLERQHPAENEQNVSMTSEAPEAPHDMSTQICGEDTHGHGEGCQVETSMDQSDKASMNGLDDSRDMSFLESELSSGELHPSFTSSPKKFDRSSGRMETTKKGRVETAGASYVNMDESTEDHNDISFRSEAETAAAGPSSQQCKTWADSDVSTKAATPDSNSDHSLLFADLSTDGASANSDDFEWDEWDDEENEGACMPMDADFVTDLHAPMLSSFLPGQSHHSTNVFTSAPCSVVTMGCINSISHITHMVDALDVVFCSDSEGDEADHPDGSFSRMFNDDGSVRANGKCRAAIEDVNEKWNSHYSTPLPEKRTNTKVSFKCGEGVDRFHEFEKVDVEHDPDDVTSHMTCMELQKLRDEEKRKRLNKSSSEDQDEEDEDDI